MLSERLPGPLPSFARDVAVAAHASAVAPILAALLTAAFVVGHVPFIAATLDGIDSANFALAVHRYDPELHQPHPPGFPVHVALGRVVNQAYRWLADVEAVQGETAAAALRIWSVLAGAIAVFSMTWIAITLGMSPSAGVLVAALVAACPLFWITAMRPLSDVPGLSFSLLSQALALGVYQRGTRRDPESSCSTAMSDTRRVDYGFLAAGLVAGVAVGVRVQTALLTLPLLVLVTVTAARRHGAAVLVQMPAAVACGMLVWVVPMMSVVGGPSEYLRLLMTVAGDDVRGVEMVATNPSPRLLALALLRTFVIPWNSTVLGFTAFVLSLAGVVALARHNRRALVVMIVMGLPYLLFHLLFQESASIRYALPLVPVSCLLAGACIRMRAKVLIWACACVLLLFASSRSLTAASAYSAARSPVARVLADIRREVEARPRAPVLSYHHAVGRAIRGEAWPSTVVSGEVGYEWLALSRYWLDGGHEPVWFLADQRRSDLALIDAAARRWRQSYRWPDHVESLLGGAQPLGISWYEIDPPGWFLERGWSLTPETHGVSTRDGYAPSITGITGHIRRRDASAVIMIAGRHTGDPFDTGATVELSIDGRPRSAWVVPSKSAFLQTISLAPGQLVGAGPYATMSVRAWDTAGTARRVDIAIEYFDVQSPGAAMLGLGVGWHSPELDPATGRSWRWTDEKAEVRAEAFGRDVALVIRGESPRRYYQSGARLVVRAGQSELASLDPRSDFEWVVPVSASTLAANQGRLVIESNRWFVPDELHGNGDRRRLAARIYSVTTRLGTSRDADGKPSNETDDLRRRAP